MTSSVKVCLLYLPSHFFQIGQCQSTDLDIDRTYWKLLGSHTLRSIHSICTHKMQRALASHSYLGCWGLVAAQCPQENLLINRKAWVILRSTEMKIKKLHSKKQTGMRNQWRNKRNKGELLSFNWYCIVTFASVNTEDTAWWYSQIIVNLNYSSQPINYLVLTISGETWHESVLMLRMKLSGNVRTYRPQTTWAAHWSAAQIERLSYLEFKIGLVMSVLSKPQCISQKRHQLTALPGKNKYSRLWS